jgi:hypothetical protein
MNELTKGELIELIRRISNADGTEAELDAMMEKIERGVPHPEVSDLIFYPPEGKELTAEEIADRALSYEPITTPASKQPEG